MRRLRYSSRSRCAALRRCATRSRSLPRRSRGPLCSGARVVLASRISPARLSAPATLEVSCLRVVLCRPHYLYVGLLPGRLCVRRWRSVVLLTLSRVSRGQSYPLSCLTSLSLHTCWGQFNPLAGNRNPQGCCHPLRVQALLYNSGAQVRLCWEPEHRGAPGADITPGGAPARYKIAVEPCKLYPEPYWPLQGESANVGKGFPQHTNGVYVIRE